MEGILQSQLLAALEDYEVINRKLGTILCALPDFVPKFLYIADHNGPIPKQLQRIVPWCRRWLETKDEQEGTLLERKILFVLDIYLQARKYYK